MTTATPHAELSPELIQRVMSLSPKAREDLAFELLDSLEDFPAGPSMNEIRQRIADIDSGKSIPMTREESEREIRAKLREIGFEL